MWHKPGGIAAVQEWRREAACEGREGLGAILSMSGGRPQWMGRLPLFKIQDHKVPAVHAASAVAAFPATGAGDADGAPLVVEDGVEVLCGRPDETPGGSGSPSSVAVSPIMPVSSVRAVSAI